MKSDELDKLANLVKDLKGVNDSKPSPLLIASIASNVFAAVYPLNPEITTGILVESSVKVARAILAEVKRTESDAP